MIYYAVTDDPNALMHYGVKGMKWGRHIFGDKPRSAAYKRASSKLAKLSKSMKSGIAKQKASWKQSAALKEKQHKKLADYKMKRMDSELNMRLKNYNQKLADKQLRKETRAENRAIRREERAEERAYRKATAPARKAEKRMNKMIQKAREGRLKYGKLSDAQVRRVTERLALERNARSLGNTEGQGFVREWGGAVRKGFMEGTTSGVASYMNARYKARGEYVGAKKYGAKKAKAEARASIKKDKILNKYNDRRDEHKAEKRERQEAKREAQEAKRVQEAARNAYEYGAVYKQDGKLAIDNPKALSAYYEQRYVKRKTLQQQQKDDQRKLDDSLKKQARITKRENDKQRRLLERSVEKAERAKKLAEAARQKAADEAERKRQAENRAAYAAEIANGKKWKAYQDRADRLGIPNYYYNQTKIPGVKRQNRLSGPRVDNRKRRGSNRPTYQVKRRRGR